MQIFISSMSKMMKTLQIANSLNSWFSKVISWFYQIESIELYVIYQICCVFNEIKEKGYFQV